MSKMTELLKALDLSPEQRELAREALAEQSANKPVTFKVGEKGAVSIYGIGRFPTTLYLSQLRKLHATDAIAGAIVFGEANGAREKSSV